MILHQLVTTFGVQQTQDAKHSPIQLSIQMLKIRFIYFINLCIVTNLVCIFIFAQISTSNAFNFIIPSKIVHHVNQFLFLTKDIHFKIFTNSFTYAIHVKNSLQFLWKEEGKNAIKKNHDFPTVNVLMTMCRVRMRNVVNFTQM